MPIKIEDEDLKDLLRLKDELVKAIDKIEGRTFE